MGWQKRRKGYWSACPDYSRATDKCWGKALSGHRPIQRPARPAAGATHFKRNRRRKWEVGMSSPLTLRGPGGPAGLTSDVRDSQKWHLQCQRFTKATFPAGAGGAGRSWPPAARVPLTVPCNWAERDSWCCWYLSATASAFRSCVCSS